MTQEMAYNFSNTPYGETGNVNEEMKFNALQYLNNWAKDFDFALNSDDLWEYLEGGDLEKWGTLEEWFGDYHAYGTDISNESDRFDIIHERVIEITLVAGEGGGRLVPDNLYRHDVYVLVLMTWGGPEFGFYVGVEQATHYNFAGKVFAFFADWGGRVWLDCTYIDEINEGLNRLVGGFIESLTDDEIYNVREEAGHFEPDPCGECDGDGEINCAACNGTCYQPCDQCGGSKEIECDICDGYGEIDCDLCDGYGEIRNGVVVRECEECMGKGTFSCLRCEENGVVGCDECDDDGEQPCEDCDSTGKEECPECDGNGYEL